MVNTKKINGKVGRPKGSKNKVKANVVEVKELEQKWQQKFDEIKLNMGKNAKIEDILDGFVDAFVIDIKQNIRQISLETLQMWFSNPTTYKDDISKLLNYYYIIDGNIAALYDMVYSLPDLTYTITPLKRLDSYEEDMFAIRNALEKTVKHKKLTRTLIIQLANKGTVLGTWLGNKRNFWFEIFNDLNYIFPWGTYRGEWVGVFDLAYLDTLNDTQKTIVFNRLSPLVTRTKYDAWKNYNGEPEKANEYRYIILPPNKSLCARNKVLDSDQQFGIPMGTQAIFDLRHKEKMKELERTLADKIIRAIATIKFSDQDDNGTKIKESAHRKTYEKVKTALTTNASGTDGVTVIGLPSWATLDFPDMKGVDDALDSEKYTSVDNDITTGTGIPAVFVNGTGSNYASAKLSLEFIYQKLGTMLEEIEVIYNQLISIVLGKSKGQYYLFEYTKGMPIEKKEKLSILKSFADMGYTIKPVLDLLGVDEQSYLDQTLYEIDNLKLREKIIPPQSAYQTNGSDTAGRTTDTTDENDNTAKSKEDNGNSTPRAET